MNFKWTFMNFEMYLMNFWNVYWMSLITMYCIDFCYEFLIDLSIDLVILKDLINFIDLYCIVILLH